LGKNKLKGSKKMIISLILGIFVLINFLYFTNLIPPIPLSLKDANVYHSVQRNNAGNYDVTYEDHGWRGYLTLYQDFNETPGSSVYAYSAIFSPLDLDINIFHEWQYYDESQNKWVTKSIIKLPVIGGRDGGFRTYSMRSNPESGKWRVYIKTESGQTIGHMQFNVVPTYQEPVLVSKIKN
jgi:hypothetical protein